MRAYLWLATLVWVAGCGQPPAPNGISIVIEVGADLTSLPTNPTLSTAFLTISQLQVISDVDTEGLGLEDSQSVSLLEGDDFALLEAPPALYSRLRIKLDKPDEDDDNLPEEFNGEPLSVLFLGEVQISNDQTVPFRFQSSRPFTQINMPFPENLDLAPGDAASLRLTQDLSTLFSTELFAQVQASDLTDGVLLIDATDTPFLVQHPTLNEISTQIEGELLDAFSLSLE